MLHVICTRLRPGHLSVPVGDSSRRCEEIVKKSRIAPLNTIIDIIIIIIVVVIIVIIVVVVVIIINLATAHCNEVLYAGLPRISITIRERRLRFSGHCWRSRDKVVSDLLLWEPKHGKRSVGGQARTFVDLLEGVPRDCLPAVMDDRVGWRKRVMRGRLWST